MTATPYTLAKAPTEPGGQPVDVNNVVLVWTPLGNVEKKAADLAKDLQGTDLDLEFVVMSGDIVAATVSGNKAEKSGAGVKGGVRHTSGDNTGRRSLKDRLTGANQDQQMVETGVIEYGLLPPRVTKIFFFARAKQGSSFMSVSSGELTVSGPDGREVFGTYLPTDKPHRTRVLAVATRQADGSWTAVEVPEGPGAYDDGTTRPQLHAFTRKLISAGY